MFQVGSKVKIVNFHGEVFALTIKLGAGYVRSFFVECGERRAYVYFPKRGSGGSYPVEMLAAA